MQDTFSSDEKKITAIIICDPADPISGLKALKYSYVDNRPRTNDIPKFVSFAGKFPTARHINFYSRQDGRYLGRIYIVENQN